MIKVGNTSLLTYFLSVLLLVSLNRKLWSRKSAGICVVEKTHWRLFLGERILKLVSWWISVTDQMELIRQRVARAQYQVLISWSNDSLSSLFHTEVSEARYQIQLQIRFFTFGFPIHLISFQKLMQKDKRKLSTDMLKFFLRSRTQMTTYYNDSTYMKCLEKANLLTKADR